MRIVGGEFKNRKILSPKGQEVRPTGERVREAIFNILYAKMDFDGINVADMCCGTGALGLEALSRGAAFCTFVDLDTKPVINNVVELDVQDKTFIIRTLAQKARITKKADLVFLDPPYYKELAEKIMKSADTIGNPDAIWVVEVEKDHELVIKPEVFDTLDERRYGHSKIYILQQK